MGTILMFKNTLLSKAKSNIKKKVFHWNWIFYTWGFYYPKDTTRGLQWYIKVILFNIKFKILNATIWK